MPHNAHYVYENCVACGITYRIQSDWECDAGLIKSGDDCICPSGMYETQSECENANPNSNCTQDVKCYKPYDCKDGYAKSVSGCKNPNGYTLGATDAYGCAECKEKECGSVWVYKPDYSSGSESSGMEYVDSSPDSSVEVCGNAGATGWKRTIVSGRFSGTKACYACRRNNCPSGYTTNNTSAESCGSDNWTLDIASVKSGENLCTKCVYNAPSCPDGYYPIHNLTSATRCGSMGEKGWYIEKLGSCAKCAQKDCQAGLRESSNERITVTVEEKNMSFRIYLKQGNEYFFTFEPNGYYSGDTRCGEFIFSLDNFCSEYRREVANCASKTKEESGYEDDDAFWDCVDGVDESWDSHFDNVNRCHLCMGVFGSRGDRYFCRDLWYW